MTSPPPPPTIVPIFSSSFTTQAGLPTLTELTKCVECTMPVAKGLKKLAGRPSKAAVASVLDSLKSCMKKLADVASKCEGPAVMGISAIPTVGQVVALSCSMASSMVEKYDSRAPVKYHLALVSQREQVLILLGSYLTWNFRRRRHRVGV